MKFRGKRRNTVESYQGKYKKMNSGKYLYKLQSAAPPQNHVLSLEKKSLLSKKRNLRYFDCSFVDLIKNFILKINKKEEEKKILKKKKKAENQNIFPNQITSQASGNFSFDDKSRSKADDSNARDQHSKIF